MFAILKKSGPKYLPSTYVEIGKYSNGDPCTIDIAKWPHTLIGGTTGGGKSGTLNAILTQMLYEPIEFYGFDAKKGVELSRYRSRFAELSVTPKEATESLLSLLPIGQERLEFVLSKGVRDWNLRWGPRIVAAIDELSEFMSLDLTVYPGEEDLSDKDISALRSQELKQRQRALDTIARLYRAAGITLLMATQHPHSDLISTQVKNNLGVRICTRVQSTSQYNVIMGDGMADGVSHLTIPKNLDGAFLVSGTHGSMKHARLARGYWYDDNALDDHIAAWNAQVQPEQVLTSV